jgi:lysophospholipase L1-like esterase
LDNNNKIADGIHFNKTGYKQVVDEYLLDVLAKVVEKRGG